MSDTHTLRTYFQGIFLPNQLAHATAGTVKLWLCSVARWEQMTGPAMRLSSIYPEVLVEFRRHLSVGKHGRGVCGTTVVDHLRRVSAILHQAYADGVLPWDGPISELSAILRLPGCADRETRRLRQSTESLR